MFGTIKLIVIAGIIAAAGFGLYYVSNLQKELAVSKINTEKLESAVAIQKEVIATQKQEFEQIRQANTQIMNALQETQSRLATLNSKFDTKANGEARDLNALALAKPKVIEKVINKASKKAMRCIEIASGAPVTAEELSVTKLSEANNECPHIHPNLGESIGTPAAGM